MSSETIFRDTMSDKTHAVYDNKAKYDGDKPTDENEKATNFTDSRQSGGAATESLPRLRQQPSRASEEEAKC